MVARTGGLRPFRTRVTGAAGFSLMELVVSAAISIVVVGGAVVASKQVQEGYGQQLETAAAEQEARYAVDWIQRLLRQAGSNPYAIRVGGCLPAALSPSSNGFPPVMRDPNGDGINNDIRIFADAGSSNGLIGGLGPALGGCTEANEDLTVAYSAANLNITLADQNQPALGTQVMTDGVVTGLLFSYMDRNRVATTDMKRVAWINVSVTTQSRLRDPHSGGFTRFPVSVDVRLRARW